MWKEAANLSNELFFSSLPEKWFYRCHLSISASQYGIRSGVLMKSKTSLMLIALAMLLTGCSLGRNKKVAYNEPQAVNPKGPQYQVVDNSKVPRTVKDLKKPAELFLAYGAWETQLGHYDQARTAFEKALEKDPESVEAKVGLAEVLDLEGKAQQAEKAYQQLVKEYPDSTKVRSSFGRFYVSQRRFPQALEQFKAGYQLDPSSKQASFELGVVLAEVGRCDEAITYMSRSVGQTSACINVAYILRRNGHQEAAGRYLAQAQQSDPAAYQAAIMQVSHNEETKNPSPSLRQSTGVSLKQVPMTVEKTQPMSSDNPSLSQFLNSSRR